MIHTFEMKGNGPPLLLLHGWGHSHKVLIPLAKILAQETTPYLVDLPGFGESCAPEKVMGCFDYAEEIARFLDKKKVEKIHLLGHSFGGKVALCFAHQYPHRIDRLVLLASSGLKKKRSLLKQIQILALVAFGKCIKHYDRLLGYQVFERLFVPRFASSDYKNAKNLRNIFVKVVNEDLSDKLPNIFCKTLLLYGGRDEETPLEIGQRLASLLPFSRLYTFPQHDHYLYQETGAHLLATYILPFLREAPHA